MPIGHCPRYMTTRSRQNVFLTKCLSRSAWKKCRTNQSWQNVFLTKRLSRSWQNVFLTKRLRQVRPDKTSKAVLTKRLPDKTSKAVLTKRLPDKTSILTKRLLTDHGILIGRDPRRKMCYNPRWSVWWSKKKVWTCGADLDFARGLFCDLRWLNTELEISCHMYM